MNNSTQRARMSRRHLLVGLGAGMIGSAAGVAPALAAVAPRGAGGDLARGTMADWAARTGERFALANGGALRLVAVEPLCSGGPTPSRSQCFAAVFEAAAGPLPAGDATYVVAPESGPALPLYFGARAKVRGRTRLAAVFN